MTQSEFIGSLMLAVVPILGVITVFTKAAWNLSRSITKLEETMKIFWKEFETNSTQHKLHEEKLHNHDLRIQSLEDRYD